MAIDRTRHNLSLIGGGPKSFSNSIIAHHKVGSIEFKLPKEPDSNKNKKKPSSSQIGPYDFNGSHKKVEIVDVDEEEYPEIQIEELVSLPIQTEIADVDNLPKIKMPDEEDCRSGCKSPV